MDRQQRFLRAALAALAAAASRCQRAALQATRERRWHEGPINGRARLTPTSGTVAAAGTDMQRLGPLLQAERRRGRRPQDRRAPTRTRRATRRPTLTKARKARRAGGREDPRGTAAGERGLRARRLPEGDARPRRAQPGLLLGRPQPAQARPRTTVRAGGWQSSSPTHPAGDGPPAGLEARVTLCNDYAFGYESCGGFVNTFTDHGGEVVKQLYAPLGTSDYSSYLAQIDPDAVDGVFVQTVGADSPRFLQVWDEPRLQGARCR